MIRLIYELQRSPEAQRQAGSAADISPQLRLLRRWQSERLQNTYSDLLADPQYQAACRFFLTDIYSENDFSQRDYDAERLHALLSRYLPERMLRLLAGVIRLNRLSSHLDRELLAALEEPQNITPADYIRAYRLCDNYAARHEQIELLAQVLREAALGARRPIFTVSLRLARLPAYRAGWDQLYDLLERGYTACRPMHDVHYFVGTIYQRETAILNHIFSGSSDPFQID